MFLLFLAKFPAIRALSLVKFAAVKGFLRVKFLASPGSGPVAALLAYKLLSNPPGCLRAHVNEHSEFDSYCTLIFAKQVNSTLCVL